MATRALVLGGGGPVGIAWESGLVAGLAEQGVRLAEADYFLGTSAGSFVGAQLALGKSPQELLESQFSAAERFEGSERASAPPPNTSALVILLQGLASGSRSLEEIRLEAGRLALETETISENDFVAMMSALHTLPEGWSDRRFGCTAIDALTGEQVVWDNESGVPMNRAVSSSCAVPGIYPPITINGRRYYDGGIGSATNSALATGYDRVVILALGGGSNARLPAEMQKLREQQEVRFQAEVQALRDGGSEVEVIRPDEEAAEAFGLNLMDARRRKPAAEAGVAQGRREAERVSRFWN